MSRPDLATPAPATGAHPVPWAVVVPLKGLDSAKSRLAPGGEDFRRSLALAMASDTVRAAVAVVGRGRVLVVTDDPGIATRMAALGAGACPDPGTGLNDAVRAGAAEVRGRLGSDLAVAALVGDLPCLTPADLAAVLDAAGRHPRAFVADADGTGTVLVTAGPGVDLLPRFGVASAARHSEVAAPLDAPPSVRLDVDDVRAWHQAEATGTGPHSRAAADSLGGS